MEFAEYFMWTNICVCLPLTTLVIFLVFCMVRREQAPIIYYINILTSNLTQFIMIIIFLKHLQYPVIYPIYMIGGMISLYFRTFIAMERCFVITRPQWNWIRQTGKTVMIWSLCIIIVTLSMVFGEFVPVVVFALLPAPLFIFFSAWTFKALPAATSVPTEEKRRIVGTLVLLLVNYFLMILPTIIYIILIYLSFHDVPFVTYIPFALFQLSPFADLILAFFLPKGAIDKVLSCLCCCITENTAADGAGHELMSQQEREREKMNQTV